jgi:hypothetical protein
MQERYLMDGPQAPRSAIFEIQEMPPGERKGEDKIKK